jgi:hypothetical protein
VSCGDLRLRLRWSNLLLFSQRLIEKPDVIRTVALWLAIALVLPAFAQTTPTAAPKPPAVCAISFRSFSPLWNGGGSSNVANALAG